MRIFVTGASGFVGSAVVRDLVAAGHSAIGVARSDAGAAAVTAAGASVYRADLTDPAHLARGAIAADAVIHCGFIHDFTKFAESCALDRRVIAALADVLAGSQRPLVITSGIGVVPGGREITEDFEPGADAPNPRVATELEARAQRDRGINVSLVRLPPTTHGEGDHGFVPMLVDLARERGAAAYANDGANHWSACHRIDAAKVFRLAVERGTPGVYHAVHERGVPFRDIAAVIGKRLGVPVVAKAGPDIAAHFGWFAHFATMDLPASSARTREQLGWAPAMPGLLVDLDQPYYFT
ncbi:MAG TPA: SDR family oxidoreductase [Kofleriaceae bacterium]|jgi:nucleoside-diphosphate-sugar epimerase